VRCADAAGGRWLGHVGIDPEEQWLGGTALTSRPEQHTSGRATLVIMARYPARGQVKARLAQTIGTESAYALYRAFLFDLDVRLRRAASELVWAFVPPDRDFAAAIHTRARCVPQEGEDLGQRMHNCFRRLCDEGIAAVVMVGADCPHVRLEWLAEARAALAGVDVVLGPSVDGGYYLIAMREPHDLFSDICMGTPTVLDDTLRRIEHLGLRAHLLPQTFDIDDVSDLDRLRHLLRDARLARQLPHTVAALVQIP
jgi:rSAM/selenodomain-associated transferase 1